LINIIKVFRNSLLISDKIDRVTNLTVY